MTQKFLTDIWNVCNTKFSVVSYLLQVGTKKFQSSLWIE